MTPHEDAAQRISTLMAQLRAEYPELTLVGYLGQHGHTEGMFIGHGVERPSVACMQFANAIVALMSMGGITARDVALWFCEHVGQTSIDVTNSHGFKYNLDG